VKIVELFEGTLFECQMIKNLLENEGIESQLTDEIIGSRAGAAWRTAGGVRIIVSDEFYEQAKMVVDEFEKSRKDNG
jgi:NADH:ubiquinone oxidoreductase subunit D